MSFKCDRCSKVFPNHDAPIKTVTSIRDKEYPKRFAADGKTVIDNGGHGWEVAKEENLCATCRTLFGLSISGMR